MNGKKAYKRKGIIAVISILCLLLFGLFYGFYADEFIHKFKCVNDMVSGYKDDMYVREAFVNINTKIKSLAKADGNNEFCVPEAFADDEKSSEYFSLISEKYSFLRNPIYGIIYENENIYYMFEEAEYVFVYSENKEIDLQAVNNSADYFRYKLDDNMYLLIKYRYYD